MKCLLILLTLLLSSCQMRDRQQDDHTAKMLANIIVTAQAQRHEQAPPVTQTSTAIETTARAGLKVLGYQLDE